MNIKFDRIDTKSGMDGLELLKEISNDQDSFGESPVPKEINEYLYRGFLLLSEEESKLDNESPCDRYWVLLDDKKIGYADIKHCLDDESRRIGGNIGIVLSKEYRNKGLGKVVMKELMDKAINEIGLKEILVTTDEKNIPMRKLCEELGGELSDIDGHCHYWFKNNKKIYK